MPDFGGLTFASFSSDPRKVRRVGDALDRKHRALHISVLGEDQRKFLTVLAHRRHGRLVGGAFACVTRDWLVVQFLWLDREHRRQGLGREMMHRLEASGAKNGCRWAKVETGDNQAPWFYPKIGYRCLRAVRYTVRRTGYFYAKSLISVENKRHSAGFQAVPPTVLSTRETDRKTYVRLLRRLDRRMAAFATRDVEPLHRKFFALVARDPQGRMVGGVTGVSYWDWMEFDLPWAAEEWKTRGLEEVLISKTEAEARRRGCRHLQTAGYDFRVACLRRMGYRPVVTYKDFPKGHSRFLLMKTLRVKGKAC